ncbi:hypothetical protein [Micromonospora sp. NPDC093277]|uniref:hypothetical protein n=1 Tax=Micromonospora sp. NPDC093277 TaxID=3364291 RepID=UPI00381710BC
MRTVGLSLGHRTDEEAEHWLRDTVRPLGLPGMVACTHLVREPWPHVAISLTVAKADVGRAGPGRGTSPAGRPSWLPATPAELCAAAEYAATEHAALRSGRAVLFPGVERLTGAVTVGELLAASAIDQVILLGGEPADAEDLVLTRDFVRPQWRDRLLTLIVTPAGPGRVAPFEVPNPTPCCADH